METGKHKYCKRTFLNELSGIIIKIGDKLVKLNLHHPRARERKEVKLENFMAGVAAMLRISFARSNNEMEKTSFVLPQAAFSLPFFFTPCHLC